MLDPPKKIVEGIVSRSVVSCFCRSTSKRYPYPPPKPLITKIVAWKAGPSRMIKVLILVDEGEDDGIVVPANHNSRFSSLNHLSRLSIEIKPLLLALFSSENRQGLLVFRHPGEYQEKLFLRWQPVCVLPDTRLFLRPTTRGDSGRWSRAH